MTRCAIALLALLGTAACSAGTELTVDGSFVALAVTGTVRTADGAPVSGATLHVVARAPGTCVGTFADGHATTDATGAFAQTVANWNVPRDVCLWIAVLPPAGAGLAADTITVQPARLDLVAHEVAVAVTLPAAAGF